MKSKTIHLLAAAASVALLSTITACGDGGSFTDARDGQKYRTVKIGDQVWMAEDLKYKGGSSSCGEKSCGYEWDSALVACPEGWHLPSKAELENVASDTNFNDLWSSTEKEDFTLIAYAKKQSISSANKTNEKGVRCIQGNGIEQSQLKNMNGYKVFRIGKQIWMAKNLDIETPNSVCYLEDEEECSKGRFYPISEAENVCPEGWRLPNKKDASMLINKLSKICKEYEPYKSEYGLDECSFVLDFQGQKMGYYKDDGQFKNGTGSMIIGYWLLSDGNIIENHVDLRVEKIDRWDLMAKFNIRCIVDAEIKE